METSIAVIPGHCQQVAQSAAMLAVNPESRHRVALLDSGFKRFALAPE
jgi:hypothetical protein